MSVETDEVIMIGEDTETGICSNRSVTTVSPGGMLGAVKSWSPVSVVGVAVLRGSMSDGSATRETVVGEGSGDRRPSAETSRSTAW